MVMAHIHERCPFKGARRGQARTHILIYVLYVKANIIFIVKVFTVHATGLYLNPMEHFK
jgi:hypothetical protein